MIPSDKKKLSVSGQPDAAALVTVDGSDLDFFTNKKHLAYELPQFAAAQRQGKLGSDDIDDDLSEEEEEETEEEEDVEEDIEEEGNSRPNLSDIEVVSNEVNMAISLSNAFVTLFDAEVKQAYQGKAMLVGAVRQRRGVEGSTVRFPKVGRGVATARVTQTDVTPMNVGFSTVTCTLGDWNAAEYSDIFKEEWIKYGEEPQYGSYYIAVDLAGFEEVAKDCQTLD